MKNYFIIGLISLLMLGVIPSTSQAKVSNGFLTNDIILVKLRIL